MNVGDTMEFTDTDKPLIGIVRSIAPVGPNWRIAWVTVGKESFIVFPSNEELRTREPLHCGEIPL